MIKIRHNDDKIMNLSFLAILSYLVICATVSCAMICLCLFILCLNVLSHLVVCHIVGDSLFGGISMSCHLPPFTSSLLSLLSSYPSSLLLPFFSAVSFSLFSSTTLFRLLLLFPSTCPNPGVRTSEQTSFLAGVIFSEGRAGSPHPSSHQHVFPPSELFTSCGFPFRGSDVFLPHVSLAVSPSVFLAKYVVGRPGGPPGGKLPVSLLIKHTFCCVYLK